MSAYDIAEVQVYRIPGGALVPASDVQPLTAYQTGDGQLFETREAARQTLLVAAIQVVGAADAFTVGAAHAAQPGTSGDDVDRVRYAILYLAAAIKGEV